MTRDFLGKEIKIGDKVVAMRYRGTSALLYEGIVEKVSPKTVCVKKKSTEEYDWGMHDVMRVDASKVIVINDIAIKEFVEKLTDKISVYSKYVDVDGIVILNRIFRMIEDTEKEMTEVQE